VKRPRTVLAAAIAAITLPAALATTGSIASAGGITPPVTISIGAPPPPCSPGPTYLCGTINNAENQGHTATFTGTYTAKTGSFNDTGSSTRPGTCVEGSSAVGTSTCDVSFTGGIPGNLCKGSTTTPWYLASPGQVAWTYIPATAESSQTLTGDRLFAEGGGVVDFQSVTPQQDGSLLIYRIHIQIQSLCGNEDTAQGLVDNISGRLGFGAGAVDLSKTYKFTGYIDVL
jgi:hypothetical protein